MLMSPDFLCCRSLITCACSRIFDLSHLLHIYRILQISRAFRVTLWSVYGHRRRCPSSLCLPIPVSVCRSLRWCRNLNSSHTNCSISVSSCIGGGILVICFSSSCICTMSISTRSSKTNGCLFSKLGWSLSSYTKRLLVLCVVFWCPV